MAIHILHGSVQMNHKSLPVEVRYGAVPSEEGVQVGEDTFVLSGYGPRGFDARRKGTLNGETAVDEGLFINMNPMAIEDARQDMKGFAAMWDITNADEVHYSEGDNALILRWNNLSDEWIANFAHMVE